VGGGAKGTSKKKVLCALATAFVPNQRQTLSIQGGGHASYLISRGKVVQMVFKRARNVGCSSAAHTTVVTVVRYDSCG
jgi:hypothetical protein